MLHQDAGRNVLEERYRQAQQMAKCLGRDPYVDLVGRIKQEVAPQKVEDRIERQRGDRALGEIDPPDREPLAQQRADLADNEVVDPPRVDANSL